jgi:hypothetical protein
MFTKKWFFDLDKRLRDAALDSDSESFDTILTRLSNKAPLSQDEFARQAAYVILAGGFSQKTAKKIHEKIMNHLAMHAADGDAQLLNDMLVIFNNKNKVEAILKIWQNRGAYRDGYYSVSASQKSEIINHKLDYLSSLPHIGKITANHLARNLGENVVKYDIWIQRLGVMYAADSAMRSKIDNGNLDTDIKRACDDMFAHLEHETGLPRGYIDVVLWKACQNGYIKL